MERGAAVCRPRRAHGACSHTAGRACASSNRTSRFKSETASRSARGGEDRGETPPRGQAPGDGTRAPWRCRGKQKELTPHRARFAFDWGEYPGGDAGTGMYSKRTGACDWK